MLGQGVHRRLGWARTAAGDALAGEVRCRGRRDRDRQHVVGRAQIDLSDIGEGGAVEVGCDQLRVELAADLWLTVTTAGAQNGEQGREPA